MTKPQMEKYARIELVWLPDCFKSLTLEASIGRSCFSLHREMHSILWLPAFEDKSKNIVN
jgi:hypothetical protein